MAHCRRQWLATASKTSLWSGRWHCEQDVIAFLRSTCLDRIGTLIPFQSATDVPLMDLLQIRQAGRDKQGWYALATFIRYAEVVPYMMPLLR